MSKYSRTKAGIAICPYFVWQSENVEGRGMRENDVNLTFCNHIKNPNSYEGNCQEKWCPLLELKQEKEQENE